MTQPNILWICTDQQRWDTISALGFKGLRTPNIDSLGKDGVAFRNTYTQSPICTPSRATFLTGMYPAAHKVQRNGCDAFPDGLELLPHVFRDAGYHTGLIGKLHLAAAQNRIEKRADDGYEEFYWSQYPYPEKHATPEVKKAHDYHNWLIERGVDPDEAYSFVGEALTEGVPSEYHQTTWAGERARRFINAHKDKPWFLSINLFDPHPPFDPPAEYVDRIDPAAVPMPAFRESDLEHHKRFRDVDQQTVNPVDPRIVPQTGAGTAVPEGRESHDTPPDSYDARKIKVAYFAMIELIDDMVGALLRTLKETGQDRDTLVLFMSDHGEMLGDHGLLYKGCRFYEGLVHVPMLISWPGRTVAGISDALVELVDLPATLCDAAKVPRMYQDQGKSLFPLLTGKAPLNTHKDRVLSEFWDAISFPGSRGSRGSMYFDGRYKLNIYHDVGEGELFDLETDPDEFVDLWNDPDHAALRARLTERAFSEMMLVTGIGPERVADF
ncbi:sulfatase-like hydrolase/transferase [Martelella mediterranea]|uniref:sulfatase family protein n=1 Tax=Martelella mediterranea TaxID=293089 RepID=UPI001E3C416E|nr:sulfatase-like hydrolase/transferase [Martelella mediterranea]MCD1636423.1 sulfatase-like hydrolase/transferase [Martelella mediterranea]